MVALLKIDLFAVVEGRCSSSSPSTIEVNVLTGSVSVTTIVCGDPAEDLVVSHSFDQSLKAAHLAQLQSTCSLEAFR